MFKCALALMFLSVTVGSLKRVLRFLWNGWDFVQYSSVCDWHATNWMLLMMMIIGHQKLLLGPSALPIQHNCISCRLL